MTNPSALLDPADLAEAGPPEAVRIPLDLVDPNPNNPRRDLREVEALAQNIKAFGLLQPVTVRRVDDRYELLGGHRRRAAFDLLRGQEPHDPQWRSIPAVVRTADDERAFLMLLSSQLHTRSWRPREEAAALERLAIDGLTLKQIGERLQRTESWASKRLRVYADSILSGFVQSGRLNAATAEELLRVTDLTVRQEMAQRAADEQWSQAQARTEVGKLTASLRLRDLARRARELLDALSSVDPRQVPIETTRDLWTLHGRIEVLARGQERHIPTIEEAQRAAGVNPNARPKRPARRTKFRAT